MSFSSEDDLVVAIRGDPGWPGERIVVAELRKVLVGSALIIL